MYIYIYVDMYIYIYIHIYIYIYIHVYRIIARGNANEGSVLHVLLLHIGIKIDVESIVLFVSISSCKNNVCNCSLQLHELIVPARGVSIGLIAIL